MPSFSEYEARINGTQPSSKFDQYVAMINGTAGDGDSLAGGFARQVANGATFGAADNVVSAVSGDSAAEDWRRNSEQYAKQHPWLSTGGKMLGAVAGVIGPGKFLTALKVGGKAKAGVDAVTGANNIRKAAAAGSTKELAAQSAIGSAKVGALTRAGDADLEADEQPYQGEGSGVPNALAGVTRRTTAAGDPLSLATDATVGAVAGPALKKVIDGTSGIATSIRNWVARSRGEAGAEGGVVRAARGLQDDGVTPQMIRDVALPGYGRGRTAMPQADIEQLISRYGELMASGMDDLAARQAVSTERAAAGVKPSAAKKQTDEIVKRWNGRNAVPSQVNELAAIATEGGEAAGTHQIYRGAINMKGGVPQAAEVADKGSPTGAILDEHSMAMNRLRFLTDMLMGGQHSLLWKGAKLAANHLYRSDRRIPGQFAENFANNLYRKDLGSSLKVLGTNTDSPHLLFQALRDLEAAQRYAAPVIPNAVSKTVSPFVATTASPEVERSRAR